MKSLKREGFTTAHEIAVCKGYNDLVPILEPKSYHIIPSSSLEKLETSVHNLMQKLAGDKVFYSYPIFQENLKYLLTHYSFPPLDYETRNSTPSVISHDGDGHSESFLVGSHPNHVRSEFPPPSPLTPPAPQNVTH